MSLQQLIPVFVALITAFIFRKRLFGSELTWRFYPIVFAIAVGIAAVIGIGQFWIPQIQMGLGTKGLPLIVFLIVGSRAAMPTAICMLVLLVGIGLFALLQRNRSETG